MNMKLTAKQRLNDVWTELKVPADYKNLDEMSKFLGRVDGTDTIVVDEESKRYYCGTNELVETCRRQGKSADILLPLAVELYPELFIFPKEEAA